MDTSIKVWHPQTSKQLNYWQTIGMPSRGARLHEALHNGLPYSVYSKLAEISGLDKKELAKVTVIAPATLQRRAKDGRFNKNESDRLYRFAEVFKAAIDLFEGDTKAATRWLSNPVRGLGDRHPTSMLGTSAETTAVLDIIGRLEFGVLV
ncbi:MAG: putative toxin-antitoxin system antitoxin component (TIGR02293 family) [Phenylobacterium sp.]|jgi:putative toxin-antitoxin system antitoxin component (TIGR02293 family)